MPGGEAADEFIPNTASANFIKGKDRLHQAPALTANIDFLPPEAAQPFQSPRAHKHMFASGSKRFVDPVHHEADYTYTPPGMGSARGPAKEDAVFKSTSGRWSIRPTSATKDVHPVTPRGIGDSSARGVSWERSKSPRTDVHDDAGYSPRFPPAKSITGAVEPVVPPGVGHVKGGSHAVFKRPSHAGGDRFHEKVPLTANAPPAHAPGIGELAAAGRLKGGCQPRSARFTERKHVTANVESHATSTLGKDARCNVSWERGSKRFVERRPVTADVETCVTAGMADKVAVGKESAAFRSKSDRFAETVPVTRSVPMLSYSSFKPTGAARLSSGKRFKNEVSVSAGAEYVDPDLGGIAHRCARNSARPSAGFKSDTQRFQVRKSATKDAEPYVGAGIGDATKGVALSKSDRFPKTPQTTLGHESTYAGDTISGRVAAKAHSKGSPGLGSASPRFRAKTAQTRVSEEEAPVRGLAYVITRNQNTFNAKLH